MLGDARHHSGADLFAVVESEYEVLPAISFKSGASQPVALVSSRT
jgi:hypothetical protein